MKSAIDTVKGQVVMYDPERGEITIKAKYEDWFYVFKREYKECLIQLIDNRPLSDKQRRACYAMIRSIAEYSGMEQESAKNWLKIKFVVEELQETADKMFSLSNAPMSLVCQFQQFLIDFILAWDIPTKYPLIEMADDVGAYMYSCLVNKRCCICGKAACLHHVDAVGAGRNRKKINHVGMRAEALCWEHHAEVHNRPQKEFDDDYHLVPVPIDKAIVGIWGLNGKSGITPEIEEWFEEEEANAE